MSRSNYDQPFYVDVGTSIVAIRCASNHDVIIEKDHVAHGKWAIEEAHRLCDRMNQEAAIGKTKKPPLGLVPRYIRDGERVTEILEAIGRYNDAGQPVPQEWLDELAAKVPSLAPVKDARQSAETGILRSALERIVDLLRRESPMHEDGVDPVDILDIAREALKQAEGVSK